MAYIQFKSNGIFHKNGQMRAARASKEKNEVYKSA